MLPWYCTREQVKAALDVAETARADTQIDRLIAASSRAIEGAQLAGRRLYPELATKYFSWPDPQMGTSWRLWLGQHRLIQATAVTAGGITLDLNDLYLEPQQSGPPYNRIETNLSSSAMFSADVTPQRAVAITGLWGETDDVEPGGQLAEDIDLTETAVDVTDSSIVGVGDLIRVGSERMQVTGKTMLTTGQTLQAAVDAQKLTVALTVTSGAGYAVGETLLLDAERMQVVDIAANTLIVRRSTDGSVLAAHNGSTIYAPRTLTVARAQVGTTAATHTTGAAITKWLVPDPARELCIAETLVALGREQSGYARTVGSGENVRAAPGGDIRDLRATVQALYRRSRKAAV